MFPEEYLRHVNEKHTHYTVEMRHPDGIMLCQGDVHPRVYHHGNRDMASLYIGPETDIVEHYSDHGLEIELELLSKNSSRYPLPVGEVSIHVMIFWLKYRRQACTVVTSSLLSYY